MEETTNSTQQETAGKATFEQVLSDPDYRRAFDERVRAAVGRRFRTVDAQRAQMRELAGAMARRLGLTPGEDGEVDLRALRAALTGEGGASGTACSDRSESAASSAEPVIPRSEATRESAASVPGDAPSSAPAAHPRTGEIAGAGLPDGPHDRTQTPQDVSPSGRGEPKDLPDPAADDPESPVRAAFRGLMAEGEALRRVYPGFDLGEALADPRFAGLLVGLRRVGAPEPVRLAFEAVHHDELTRAAVRAAVERTAAGLAETIRSAAHRPAENGGTSAAGQRVDPAALSPEQRRDIRARVMRGERVTF